MIPSEIDDTVTGYVYLQNKQFLYFKGLYFISVFIRDCYILRRHLSEHSILGWEILEQMYINLKYLQINISRNELKSLKYLKRQSYKVYSISILKYIIEIKEYNRDITEI